MSATTAACAAVGLAEAQPMLYQHAGGTVGVYVEDCCHWDNVAGGFQRLVHAQMHACVPAHESAGRCVATSGHDP